VAKFNLYSCPKQYVDPDLQENGYVNIVPDEG
jgi:hypothetical protein